MFHIQIRIVFVVGFRVRDLLTPTPGSYLGVS